MPERTDRAGELLADPDVSDGAIEYFADRADAIMGEYKAKIDGFMSSDLPGREVAPLAIYFRCLRRIVANLLGVVRTSVEPLSHLDYLENGTVDTED